MTIGMLKKSSDSANALVGCKTSYHWEYTVWVYFLIFVNNLYLDLILKAREEGTSNIDIKEDVSV